MKKAIVLLALGTLTLAGAVNAKIIHRWDPVQLAQGKFVPVKSAFVKKEEIQLTNINVENKHILVKIDYTGKLFTEPRMLARK